MLTLARLLGGTPAWRSSRPIAIDVIAVTEDGLQVLKDSEEIPIDKLHREKDNEICLQFSESTPLSEIDR